MLIRGRAVALVVVKQKVLGRVAPPERVHLGGLWRVAVAPLPFGYRFWVRRWGKS